MNSIAKMFARPDVLLLLAAIVIAVLIGWIISARRSRSAVVQVQPPSAPTAAQRISRSESKATVEALVLGAALEDALCHLVQVYGPEYLDAFLARRIRRNVQPFTAMIDGTDDLAHMQIRRQQAHDAEEALRRITSAVREDPTPPQ